MSSPYQILGLPNNAPIEEVKKARRKLCAKNHPDVGGDVNKFNMINKAYDDILKGVYTPSYTTESRGVSSYLRHNTLFTFRLV